MKIGIVGLKLNRENLNKNITVPKEASSFVGSQYAETKIPASAYLSNSAISFGIIKLPGSEFKDIPCGYCKDKMIPAEVFNAIKWPEKIEIIPASEIISIFKKKRPDLSMSERIALGHVEDLHSIPSNAHKPFSKLVNELPNPPKSFLEYNEFKELSPESYNSKLLDVVKSFESYLHDEQKTVFSKLKELNAQHPGKNFYELLKIVKPESLEKLKICENEVLDRISRLTEDLVSYKSPMNKINMSKEDAANEIQFTITEAREIIKTQNLERPFRRKAFIEKMKTISKVLPGNKFLRKIIIEANTLPDSQSNPDAFIVKYADKAKNKKTGEWHHRTSQEIARNIIYPSMDTMDHLNARNPLPGEVAGPTSKRNLLHTCARCNHHKENDKFKEYIEKPNVKESIQYQVDYFVDKTNDGLMYEGAEYLKDVQRTMRTATDGEFVVDLSRLKEGVPYKNPKVPAAIASNASSDTYFIQAKHRHHRSHRHGTKRS